MENITRPLTAHACFLAVALLSACGAQATDGTFDSDDTEPENTPTGSEEANKRNSSKLGKGSAFASEELPACEPGDEYEAGQRCVYRVDGLCYEARLMACACACPTSAGSTCVSGFPSSDGLDPTDVTCR